LHASAQYDDRFGVIGETCMETQGNMEVKNKQKRLVGHRRGLREEKGWGRHAEHAQTSLEVK
jgi:hypothetical protein